MPLTNEEKALKAILDAVSDIRVDMSYLGMYLQQAEGPDKERFLEMLEHAGLYMPTTDEEDTETYTYTAENLAGITWQAVLPRMLEHHNSVTREEAVYCLMDIVHRSPVIDAPYGEGQALARRIIWQFPDGNLLWFAGGQGEDGLILLSHEEDEFTSESVPPINDDILDPSDFEWSADSNGWEYGGYLNICALVDAIAEDSGSPTMILPLENVCEQIVDAELDELMSTHFEEDDEEEEAAAHALFTFCEQVQDGSLEIPDDIWDFGYDFGDGYMPRYSANGRFSNMLQELESEHNWIIIWDECCGSCSSGSLEYARQEEGKENSSFFITWAQNAEHTWMSDGAVSHMDYFVSKSDIDLVTEVATKNGLTVHFEQQDSDKDGESGFLTVS